MRTIRAPRMTPGSDHPSGDRPEVAGPAVVHVQKAGEAAFRVVELPEGPVRVGRAPQCEVRLDDIDSIGDVHCLFRRRGEAWHFQPVGPAGLVWIDELPADEQAVIPSGVPFRVGHHWLTFRSARDASNDRGSFRSPIPVEPAEPAPEPQPRPAAARTPDEVPEPAAAEGGEGTADDRLKRWQNRLDQRERWIRDRQDEKRWEARWKAAGESIKAKGARPAPPGPSAAPGRPAPAPPPASTPPPVAPMTRPTIEPRAVVRPAEARPIDPPRRVFTPAARPAPPRFPAGPRAPHPAPSGGLAQPPPARPPVGFGAPAVGPRLAVALNPPAPLPPADRSRRHQLARSPRRGTAPPPRPSRRPRSCRGRRPGRRSQLRRVRRRRPSRARADRSPSPRSPIPQARSRSRRRRVRCRSPGRSEPDLDDRGPTRAGRTTPRSGPRPSTRPVAGWEEPAAGSPARPVPVAGPVRAAWPEAGPPGRRSEAEPAPATCRAAGRLGRRVAHGPAIFAAQGRRFDGSPELAAAREPARGARKRAAIAAPTVAVAPGHWTIPLWLGLGPMAALTLVLGALGLALCWEWIGDASSASRAIRIATREAGAASPIIDLDDDPPRALVADHRRPPVGLGDGGRADRRRRGPLARRPEPDGRRPPRLAAGRGLAVRARIGPAAASDPIPLLFQVGRPRDAVTLAWTGRHLRKAGKADAALGSFRSAFALALGASRATSTPPGSTTTPRSAATPCPTSRCSAWSRGSWPARAPGPPTSGSRPSPGPRPPGWPPPGSSGGPTARRRPDPRPGDPRGRRRPARRPRRRRGARRRGRGPGPPGPLGRLDGGVPRGRSRPWPTT